jgi:hypothetical protein
VSDIVERLRAVIPIAEIIAERNAAADEIERLRKRVEFVPSYVVRCDALEEAAKVAEAGEHLEDYDWSTAGRIADAIRALKEKSDA